MGACDLGWHVLGVCIVVVVGAGTGGFLEVLLDGFADYAGADGDAAGHEEDGDFEFVVALVPVVEDAVEDGFSVDRDRLGHFFFLVWGRVFGFDEEDVLMLKRWVLANDVFFWF